ncbi:MAG: ABC transporter ATP-binding protein [Lachnospiraceae bacterium]|nr:ABC transporter ATP-binding protein [Lachnospiraceae bacterium]
MTKLAKYLKSSAGLVVAIVALLFLQAYCDLTLPEYTSKIVNEGIQQKGIEDGVPDRMRAETYDTLMTFLDEDGQSVLEDSYELDGDVYELKSSIKGEKREALADSLLDGEMVVTALQQMESAQSADSSTADVQSTEDGQNATEGASAQSETTQDAAEDASAQSAMAQAGTMQLPAGVSAVDAVKALPEAMRSQIVEQIKEKFADMPEMMTEQSAILFVQNEYEALGEDLDSFQISYLVKVGVQMVLLALLAMLASVLVTFFSARVAAVVAHDLRGDVYRKVIGFNSHEFNQFSTASLITRSTNDIQQVQMLLAMGFRLVLYSPILGIGGVLKVVKTDVSMSWIIALAVILIMIVIGVLFKVAMPRFTKLQTLIDRLNLVTREQLTGIMVSRAFSAEKHEEERFEKANQDLTKTNLFVNRCMTFMMPIMMVIMNGISVLIVYKGAYAIDGGTMQVGDLMAFIQYAMQIIMSFLMIAMMSIIIPRANVAAKRIYEVLSTEPTIHDPQQPKLPANGEKGIVEFDHVSFAYPEADEKVLEDISFRAEKGQTVAIIGSTGSGKSTLINLIPRFYDVTSGAVRVDGVDVRELAKQELCDRIGYVPQKSILFSGTIDSNLRYGCVNASEEEIKKAAEIAQASEFIEEKDEKYNTPIAQGGTNVSGGQKQRLSIARAIAKKPEILIFDDSFSALDYKTDVALRRALKESTAETTTIIVAQRISTILHADQIIVLDEGRVAGIGTHKELLKNCEVYRQIATSQLSEEELAK